MFIYFLQRKGWLDFRGDRDYLKALWNDYRQNRRETDNFHLSRLRTLFFAGLNNLGSRDLTEGTKPLIGDVPFLNGGLFDKGVLDKREGVTVPDEAIGAVLTDLLDRFNFTVMESTPFDIEVAVDPEMLGKVFEELVTGRHESGSYYTPRPVVSFMCREALKGYLEARETGLVPETIAEFVDEHRTEAIDIAAARRVAGALSKVTVVDPACGSGAYLHGLKPTPFKVETGVRTPFGAPMFTRAFRRPRSFGWLAWHHLGANLGPTSRSSVEYLGRRTVLRTPSNTVRSRRYDRGEGGGGSGGKRRRVARRGGRHGTTHALTDQRDESGMGLLIAHGGQAWSPRGSRSMHAGAALERDDAHAPTYHGGLDPGRGGPLASPTRR